MKIPTRLSLLLAGPALALALHAADAPKESSDATAKSDAKAPTYKEWTVSELTPVVNIGLRGGRNFEHGQQLFTSLGCAVCHSFAGSSSSGVGPDLTGVGGRYGVPDILSSIIEPSKVISNLYGSYIIGLTNGKQVTGKIMYQDDNSIALAEDVFNLNKTTTIKTSDIDWMDDSPYSLMPPGLINASSQDDIKDLLAYLISGGDNTNKMFKPLESSTDSTKK